MEDCESRNENVVESTLLFNIRKIKLVDNSVVEVEESPLLTESQILTVSKQNRDSAVDADILFDNVYFQVINDCADIKSSLQEASVLGLEDSYSQLWRLADNTWRQTTIAEAKQIVALFVERKQKVWAAFAKWDLGDKTSVFVYSDAEETGELETTTTEI
ncbi:MAG: hypothetical protein ACMV1B_00030 [Prevotella sp.]